MNARAKRLAGWLVGAASLGAASIAQAQTTAAPYTTGYRYDIAGHQTGVIFPDPDGTGPINFAATRNSYNAEGYLVRQEIGELASWQSDSTAPSAWSGFTVFRTIDTSYDDHGRKIKVAVSAGGAINSVTQTSYDVFDRIECTAVRMNPAVYATLPNDACTPYTAGDRITRNTYDSRDRVVKIQKAYGTARQQDYVTYTYDNSLRDYSKPSSVTDANGNLATFEYGGSIFGLISKWSFPDKATRGAVSSTDYESYTYDDNGNRLSLRKRDGQVISYTYDALNRVTFKDIPGGAATDVYYDYDLRGLQISARYGSATGVGITNTYDGFSRLKTSSTNMSGPAKTLTYTWDGDGDRKQITHPDGAYFRYDYDGLDRMNWLYEGSSSILAQIGYYSHGASYFLSRISGSVSANYYGTDLRLSAIQHDMAGTGQDVTYLFTGYNPADQLMSRWRSNDAYAFNYTLNGYPDVSRPYETNGLNQYTSAGSASFCYDDNGNLTRAGNDVYRYDIENRLVEMRVATSTTCPATYTGTVLASLSYDPLGRLYETSVGGTGVTRFLYDGDELVAEYSGSDTLLRRYVHGTSADDPLVWYEGSGVGPTNRRFYYTDNLGSIVAVADNSAAALAVNTYDEYGIPGGTNLGRFQYTGQAWIPETGMYYYKARMYSPTLGRFMQTDPIGYADQNNLYAYVGNDPFDKRDPTGLKVEYGGSKEENKILRATFKGMAATGGNWRQAYEAILASPHTLKIFPLTPAMIAAGWEVGVGPYPMNATTIENLSNGIGNDLNAYLALTGIQLGNVGPNGSPLRANLQDEFAHEIFDHAQKAIRGKLSADWDLRLQARWGTADRSEVEAVQTENAWRALKPGGKLRERYHEAGD